MPSGYGRARLFACVFKSATLVCSKKVSLFKVTPLSANDARYENKMRLSMSASTEGAMKRCQFQRQLIASYESGFVHEAQMSMQKCSPALIRLISIMASRMPCKRDHRQYWVSSLCPRSCLQNRWALANMVEAVYRRWRCLVSNAVMMMIAYSISLTSILIYVKWHWRPVI